MSTFPTLSKAANVANFTKSPSQNPTINSTMENGRILTRTKFTNVNKMWKFNYNFLTDADKDLLEAFEINRQYSTGTFFWSEPSNGVTYEVRFAKVLTFVQERAENFWSITIDLIEARPNSDIDENIS